jgi:RNA polymerase sigma-70 factor (ECF subfamily)
MLGNHQDALDAMQDTFMRFHETLEKGIFDQDRSAGPWLLTLARNISLDHYRGRQRLQNKIERLKLRLLPTREPTSAEDIIDRMDEVEHVKSIIHQLKEPYRSVLIFKFLKELSDEEIARITGIRPQSVRVYLFRALDKVRKMIKHGG